MKPVVVALVILALGGCVGTQSYPPGGGLGTFPGPIDPLSRYQDFREARIEAASIQVLADDSVVIVLRYLNKTQQDFLIHFPPYRLCSGSAGLVDDAGNEYRCTGATGIDDMYGLSFPAGSQVTASFRFEPPRQMQTKGTRFSFRSTQLLSRPIARGTPPVVARYSITLSDLEPRQKASTSEVTPSGKTDLGGKGSLTSGGSLQDFREARIETASVQVLADDSVVIVLRYLNKTQQDFLIHFPPYQGCVAGLVDDAGNEYRCTGTTGIDGTHGLSFPAGSQVTASFRFTPPRQMQTKGTHFSFRSTHLLSSPVAKGTPPVVARYAVTLIDVNPAVLAEVPRVDDIWDYPQIRVELANLQAVGDEILLAVRYTNKTQGPFLVHLPPYSCSDSTGLLDDAGNEYRCAGTTGIDSRDGLSLPAGSQATASFRFAPPRWTQSKGSRFSFLSTHLLSIPVARGTPPVVARYAVTLLRMELR
ncbi:MAG: hypothetical protein C3F12_04610 [Candidatus Methylomirabilota bacterium]|nr:MAG: hypothetical protein C3F12_04610 [candidate division NC10 bacterium]